MARTGQVRLAGFLCATRGPPHANESYGIGIRAAKKPSPSVTLVRNLGTALTWLARIPSGRLYKLPDSELA